MSKTNAMNERTKRQYFTYLKEAGRMSEASIDVVALALDRFETFTSFKDFKTFNIQQAVGFKRHIENQSGVRSGKKLSKSTLKSNLAALKRFFHWLAGQPGFKSRFTYSDAEYFNISLKDGRVATARRTKSCPTLDQVRRVLAQMPAGTDIEKRDRALVAFITLTGARDGAVVSFKLKHVDPLEGLVWQDGRDVATKNSKTFDTYFFPVGEDIREIFTNWIDHLKTTLLWGYDDPLFPATDVGAGNDGGFRALGLKRKCWSTAEPIRRIFKAAFEGAGLPYYRPHSFRHMLVRFGEQACKTPEEFKAWSQNLGHEHVLTTFISYGNVPTHRQGEVIKGLQTQ
ncbi:MAG: tyrosine-type recombinase/integrase [Rhodospirillaceae bacterium]